MTATVAERTTRRPGPFDGFTQVHMGDEVFSECNECAALIRRIPAKAAQHLAAVHAKPARLGVAS